jgi:ribosome-associated protein
MERSEQNSYLDAVPGISWGECNERKGKQPLTKPALSRASRRMPEPVSRRPSAKETLRIVLARLEDMKAEDSVTIDLTGKSSIGDYMVVTSGRSQRHVGAVADHVVKDLKAAGVSGIRVEGMRQGDWVLIDAGDVIVHVFRPEVRNFYSLEKMWSAGRPDGRRAS